MEFSSSISPRNSSKPIFTKYLDSINNPYVDLKLQQTFKPVKSNKFLSKIGKTIGFYTNSLFLSMPNLHFIPCILLYERTWRAVVTENMISFAPGFKLSRRI